MIAKFSEEFRFLLSACFDTLIAPPSTSFNWGELQRLAARHRVEGLVGETVSALPLGSVPTETAASFSKAKRALGFAYLSQLGETLRLSNLLQSVGIASIALKGAALANVYYAPHPERRHAIDIDILVDPTDFASADRLLRHEGYRRICPDFDPPEAAESMVQHLLNAFEYCHSERGIKVELHHRLLSNPYILAIPFPDLLKDSVEVRIGQGSVRALGGNALITYLSAHAAGHAFFRLKWLADIHRVVLSLTPEEIYDALAQARRWGCERPLVLSLLLQEKFGGSSGRNLEPELQSHVAPLVGHCIRALLRPEHRGEHVLRDLPSDLHTAFYGSRLGNNWRSQLFPLLRLLAHSDDTRLLKLGVEWSLLYAVLGRLLAAYRLFCRRFLKPSAEPIDSAFLELHKNKKQ